MDCNTAHRLMLECRDQILDALSAEMGRRTDRVHTSEWIERERHAVANAATAWALRHGIDVTVTKPDVERLEVSALYRVDYAEKLSLCVAEYVIGGAG